MAHRQQEHPELERHKLPQPRSADGHAGGVAECCTRTGEQGRRHPLLVQQGLESGTIPQGRHLEGYRAILAHLAAGSRH